MLLSLATLLLICASAELFMRLAGVREQSLRDSVNRTNRRWVELLRAGMFEELDDPIRRYALRPTAEVEVDQWTFRANSARARGADFSPVKAANERRLIVLGDSFCFGLWCAEQETLAGQLQSLLQEREQQRASGLSWSAFNLGVPGYTSQQQLTAFQQDGLPLDPDLVVLYFNTNDIQSQGFFLDQKLGALHSDWTPLPVALRRALWHSHLYGFCVRQIETSVARGRDASVDPAVPWAHTRTDNQQVTRAALVELASLCRQRGLPLYMVHQPLMTWSEDARRPQWQILPLIQWAEDLRAELLLPGLCLLPFLQGFADNQPRSRAADGQLPERDFLPERYFADEEVQRYFEGGTNLKLPVEPDFHLTGAGYGHIARLVFEDWERIGW